MSGYAWVTLATNDSYSLGALVLGNALKLSKTIGQLVVLVTPGVTKSMREKLATVFNLVQSVDVLDSKDAANLKLLQRPELGITFTKLHCWRLTQFEKCVFLDADTLLLTNCDELFERDEFSAASDVGWPDCFNSGVFVFKPNNETFERLIEFALAKGSFDGGDQGLLNLYFNDWAHKDITKRLPFMYNMCSVASYSYLPAFKQFGAQVKIVHFIGTTKPWLQQFNPESRTVQPGPGMKHLEPFFQTWWSIFTTNVHGLLRTDMLSGGPAPSVAPPRRRTTVEQSHPVSTEPPIPGGGGCEPIVVDCPNDTEGPPGSNPPETVDCALSETTCNVRNIEEPLESHSTSSEQRDTSPQCSIDNLNESLSQCKSNTDTLINETDNDSDKKGHITDPDLIVASNKPFVVPNFKLNDKLPVRPLNIQSDIDSTTGCQQKAGLANAFAQFSLGAPRSPNQAQLEDNLRRQNWEAGNIDYLGRDSFDNIWLKINQTLTAPPKPERKEQATVTLPAKPVVEEKTKPVETVQEQIIPSITPVSAIADKTPLSAPILPPSVPAIPTKLTEAAAPNAPPSCPILPGILTKIKTEPVSLSEPSAPIALPAKVESKIIQPVPTVTPADAPEKLSQPIAPPVNLKDILEPKPQVPVPLIPAEGPKPKEAKEVAQAPVANLISEKAATPILEAQIADAKPEQQLPAPFAAETSTEIIEKPTSPTTEANNKNNKHSKKTKNSKQNNEQGKQLQSEPRPNIASEAKDMEPTAAVVERPAEISKTPVPESKVLSFAEVLEKPCPLKEPVVPEESCKAICEKPECVQGVCQKTSTPVDLSALEALAIELGKADPMGVQKILGSVPPAPEVKQTEITEIVQNPVETAIPTCPEKVCEACPKSVCKQIVAVEATKTCQKQAEKVQESAPQPATPTTPIPLPAPQVTTPVVPSTQPEAQPAAQTKEEKLEKKNNQKQAPVKPDAPNVTEQILEQSKPDQKQEVTKLVDPKVQEMVQACTKDKKAESKKHEEVKKPDQKQHDKKPEQQRKPERKSESEQSKKDCKKQEPHKDDSKKPEQKQECKKPGALKDDVKKPEQQKQPTEAKKTEQKQDSPKKHEQKPQDKKGGEQKTQEGSPKQGKKGGSAQKSGKHAAPSPPATVSPSVEQTPTPTSAPVVCELPTIAQPTSETPAVHLDPIVPSSPVPEGNVATKVERQTEEVKSSEQEPAKAEAATPKPSGTNSPTGPGKQSGAKSAPTPPPRKSNGGKKGKKK